MTREEAIADIRDNIKPVVGGKSLDIAIASLEAWEKIKAEIDEQYDRVHPYNISCAEGLEMALGIIDKHLQEVSDKE